MRIFVDAMGGDNAPQAPVEGAIEALKQRSDLVVVLGGIKDQIEPLLANAGDVRSRIEICDCPEVISNHDAPVMAVRQKKQSPTVVGMLQVRNHECDGFVSAGSTGALLAGGMFRLGRIDGIERPALAPLLPTADKGYYLLIDSGANVDCKPEYLEQFGMMGDAYMRGVMKIEKPRVGLINIGDEAEKGNALVKATYPLMEKAPYNFIGNVEARDIPTGKADVLVADGFAGNLVLKFMEGFAMSLLGLIKREIKSDFVSTIGGALAKPAFKRVKMAMDYTEVGGAPLLGVQGAVVKAHGSSNGHAMACAIAQAEKMLDGQVVEKIQALLAASTAES